MAATTVGAATTPPSLAEFLQSLSQSAKKEPETCPAQDKYCVPKLMFSSDVDDEHVDEAIEWADRWEKAGAKALVIEINTNGGDVDAGFRLSKRIEDSAIPVHCIVDGAAYSMGLYILESCATRAMTDRSSLMAHQPALGGELHGDSTRFENAAAELRALAASMARHVIRRMRISFEEYMERTAGPCQWWLESTQALRWGAVDGVVGNVKGYMAEWHLHGKPPL